MMKNNLLFWLLVLSGVIAKAQKFNVRNYNANDDLPQTYVYTINQSSRGKLWIGTGEGLCTFDGKKFTTYTKKEGLSENLITSSYMDQNGTFWFGHFQGGITIFNGNTFEKVNTKDHVAGPVNAITGDSLGNVWLGMQREGILHIDGKRKITSFSNDLSELTINSLVCVRPGVLLAATNNGLYLLLHQGGKLKISKQYLPGTIVNYLLSKNNKQQFWIATNENGLFQYNVKTGTIDSVNAGESLAEKNINLVYEDKEQHLWVSVFGEGLVKYAVVNNSLSKLNNYNTSSGLSSNYIKSFYEDRERNIWIGTFGGGLDHLIDPVFTLFTKQDGLPSDNITAICRDTGNLWLATESALVQLNFARYSENNVDRHKTYFLPIPSAKITSIIPYDLNSILIGTAEHGVFEYNYQANKCKQWYRNTTSQLCNRIHHIKTDKDKNVWIATEDGAFCYRWRTKEMAHYNMENGLLHNNILSIFVDSQNTVWFATHGSGLGSYNNGKFTNYPCPAEISGLDINCFEEDHLGNLWIGTYGQGVFVFHDKKFIQRFHQAHGLGSNFCYLIQTDGNNNLWIGHKNGLSQYFYERKNFIFHQKKDGFLAEEFNSNTSSTDTEKNVWFGSANGLLKYDLNADRPSNVGPLIHINDVRLYFQKVDWRKYSDSLFSLYRLPAHLKLPHHENHLTFNVNGISLSNPDKVTYKYKLDGFENEWSLETNEDFITYANMQPGKYTFRAIAKNSTGIWSRQEAVLSFEIQNPFWKTWWFYALCLLTFFTVTTSIVKLRTKSLEKRQVQLQEEKERLLAEINERKKAQRLQKISEEKLRQTNQELNTFIYRASHDLRGPLSTVKGLTNLGIMEMKDEASLKYFHLISDRIMRLDMILKDLIHIVEITEIELDLVVLDMQECLEETLKEVVKPNRRNLQLTKEFLAQTEFVNDRNLIQIVLLNILDNAVKYTNPDNKFSQIHITIKDFKDGVKIVVNDNGMGIPGDILGRVFDMFFRGTDQSKGSGLGLYLVNKIIGKLEGEVNIDSTYMKGTTVEVYIPSIAKEAFTRMPEKTLV